MTHKITYSDSLSKSSEFLRLAISLLARYKMPADPHNYQISYEHVSGRNEALSHDLEHILEQSKSPPVKQFKNIYDVYFERDEEYLDIMRLELRQIISSMLKDFGYSHNELSNYSKTLTQFIDILDSHPSSASSNDLLEKTQNVIDETHSLSQSQQTTEQKMSTIIAEIDLLRKELDQVKEESKKDTLTGIANRKAFDAELEQSILTSRENNKPFCLLMLDIDHFKAFNDNYGHLVGDKVLRYVAGSLKRNIKGNDFVARYGGEEFGIILPMTGINGAITVAEQIREAISSGKLTDKATEMTYGKLTISIGVTQFRASDLGHELIERADKALYLAKERGRDRVEKL
ncbi:MAG: GGDEF domain-containing protein [Gammaproteobacteria bacterium]|nr:GGDEF domain-containing protein [Gammaproteobacteria bacterium]